MSTSPGPSNGSIALISHRSTGGVGETLRHASAVGIVREFVSGDFSVQHFVVGQTSPSFEAEIAASDLVVVEGLLPTLGLPASRSNVSNSLGYVAMTWLDVSLATIAAGKPLAFHDVEFAGSPPTWLASFIADAFSGAVRITTSSNRTKGLLKGFGLENRIELTTHPLVRAPNHRGQGDVLARIGVDSEYFVVDRSIGSSHRMFNQLRRSSRPARVQLDIMTRYGSTFVASAGIAPTSLQAAELSDFIGRAAGLLTDSRDLGAVAARGGVAMIPEVDLGTFQWGRNPEVPTTQDVSAAFDRPDMDPAREFVFPSPILEFPPEGSPNPSRQRPVDAYAIEAAAEASAFEVLRLRASLERSSTQIEDLSDKTKTAYSTIRTLESRLEKAKESRLKANEAHQQYRRDLRRRDERLREVNAQLKESRAELRSVQRKGDELEHTLNDTRERLVREEKRLRGVLERRSVKLAMWVVAVPKRIRAFFSGNRRQ